MASTLQWGDVAEWSGAVATAAAVWFAAVSVHRANKATKDARESLAWSETHLVSVQATGRRPMITVDVVNEGSRAVFDAEVMVTAAIGTEVVNTHRWPTVPPRRKRRALSFGVSDEWVWNNSGNAPIVDVEVTFTDVGRRRWKMADDGTLTSLGKAEG
jgi:hypothetical protein